MHCVKEEFIKVPDAHVAHVVDESWASLNPDGLPNLATVLFPSTKPIESPDKTLMYLFDVTLKILMVEKLFAVSA